MKWGLFFFCVVLIILGAYLAPVFSACVFGGIALYMGIVVTIADKRIAELKGECATWEEVVQKQHREICDWQTRLSRAVSDAEALRLVIAGLTDKGEQNATGTNRSGDTSDG